ncbi:MAG: stage III sporulation protein AA [Blautia sp.]|nr:stage III sporulation protein AA [Blautia sp.]MCM1201514.1 stage III sporulation protein AA [Bacteroides fragilis]
MQKEEVLHIFPDFMRPRWEKVAERADRLQEIRLRVGQPVTVLIDHRERFLSARGELTDDITCAIYSDEKELDAVLAHLCHYSIYAFADEIRQGFMTIRGGHRVGISGQVILEERERVRNIKYIRYLNIRIAHEIKGVSDKTLPCLYQRGEVLNTLIISPPGCGKTTMLRDLVRNFSWGNACGAGKNVGLVDERSEIAGSYLGVPQNDIGIRTDVMDACPKREGMMMLIRSMAPDILAVDELGSMEDVEAMHRAVQCGCKMLATIHGFSLEEVGRKSYMKAVMEERLFDRYLLLGKKNNRCVVMGIYDRKRELCSNWQESCC